MRARVAAAVALVCAVACSDSTSAHRPGSDPALIEAYRLCGDAIGEAASLEPAQRAGAIARGCAAACPGLRAYGDGVPDARLAGRGRDPFTLESCQMFCNRAAADEFRTAPVAERYARLARACGLSYFELPEDGTWLLSDHWVVLLRVHQWLRKNGRLLRNAEALHAVEAGTEHTHVLLPLPAHVAALYTLPEASAGEPASSGFYVVVGADTITTGAIPVARLRDVIERRPVPGGDFPGTATTVDELSTLYDKHESMLTNLHAHSDSSRGGAPLVLADASLPAQRAVEVARALGKPEIRLGVAGNGAFAHSVAMRLSGSPPTLTLDADHPPGSDALRIEIAHLQAAPSAGVEISTTTTVADLARALDRLADVRIGSALMLGGS